MKLLALSGVKLSLQALIDMLNCVPNLEKLYIEVIPSFLSSFFLIIWSLTIEITICLPALMHFGIFRQQVSA